MLRFWRNIWLTFLWLVFWVIHVVIFSCLSFSIGADQLIKLIPDNSSLDLESKDTAFTVFVPADKAFDHLTEDDIDYINRNLSYDDRMQVCSEFFVLIYILFLFFCFFCFVICYCDLYRHCLMLRNRSMYELHCSSVRLPIFLSFLPSVRLFNLPVCLSIHHLEKSSGLSVPFTRLGYNTACETMMLKGKYMYCC